MSQNHTHTFLGLASRNLFSIPSFWSFTIHHSHFDFRRMATSMVAVATISIKGNVRIQSY
jgi:hypothetical protein